MNAEPLWIAVVSRAYVGCEVVVAAFAVARLGRLRAGERPVAGWLIVAGTFALVEQFARVVLHNTHYVAQVWYPISGGLALWAGLRHPRQSRARLLLVAAYLAVQTGLFLTVEVYGESARAAGFVHGIALIIAGGSIVVGRAMFARHEMHHDLRFGQGMALLMIGAPSTLVALSARYFGVVGIDQTRLMYAGKNIVATIAVALLGYSLAPWGVRTQEPS